jgi:hypothetical protein
MDAKPYCVRLKKNPAALMTSDMKPCKTTESNVNKNTLKLNFVLRDVAKTYNHEEGYDFSTIDIMLLSNSFRNY